LVALGVLALGDRPRAEIPASPHRTTRMDQEALQGRAPVPLQEDDGAYAPRAPCRRNQTFSKFFKIPCSIAGGLGAARPRVTFVMADLGRLPLTATRGPNVRCCAP